MNDNVLELIFVILFLHKNFSVLPEGKIMEWKIMTQ